MKDSLGMLEKKNWSILKENDWPIQKIDFTNIIMKESMPHCQILKPCIPPTCKRLKIMAKVWFSTLICSTFKVYVKVLKI